MDLTQSVLNHISIKIGNLEVQNACLAAEIQQLKEALKQKEENEKTAE